MKNSIMIMLLIIVLVFSLTNCQSGGETKTDTKTEMKSESKSDSMKKSDKSEAGPLDIEGWSAYLCDSKPETAGFEEDGKSSPTIKVMKDKEIANNKLLKFTSGEPDGYYEFTNFKNDFTQITVVLRAKGSGTADRTWEIEVANKGLREKARLSNKEIKLEKSGEKAKKRDDGTFHIWRITMTFAEGQVTTSVYMDENETPVIDGAVSTTTDTKTRLLFGDRSGSQPYGAVYDWIIWSTDGAYKPSEKPLPASLSGVAK